MAKFQKLLSIEKQKWVLFLCCLAVFSLLYSRFVLTLSMILLLLISFIDIAPDSKFYFKISSYFKENWKKIWTNKAFLTTTLFFFIVLISGFWSEDKLYWAERVRIRLPFIVLPLAFSWLPPFTRRDYYSFFYFLLLFLSISLTSVLINYALDFDHINQTLLHGKSIPVPQNHIRYSLLLAFSIISGTILWQKKFYWKNEKERNLILFLVIYLFIGIHILAVRSGLACLYSTVSILGIYYIWKSKQYIYILVLLLFSIVTPISAYFLIPSIKNKVSYAVYDWEQFKSGNGKDYSDAERWGSILAGLKVGENHPWFGCGYGDLKNEVNIAYQEVFPLEKEPKIPHNQYIMIYAGIGLIGLAIFIFSVIFPIFYNKNYREPIFLALNLIIIFSFLVEATIETQAGTALYALFLCIGLNRLSNKEELSDSLL